MAEMCIFFFRHIRIIDAVDVLGGQLVFVSLMAEFIASVNETYAVVALVLFQYQQTGGN